MKTFFQKAIEVIFFIISVLVILLGIALLVDGATIGGGIFMCVTGVIMILLVRQMKKNRIAKLSQPAITATDEPKSTPVKKNTKQHYTFRAAGVTHQNDSGENIQDILKGYAKETLEYDEPYEGLKNKEILEDYFDEFVYETSDVYIPGVISLVPEPTNQYDPNSIKIMTSTLGHVGYVPREETRAVKEIIDNHDPKYTAEVIGGKYKYVDEMEEKVRTATDKYGISIELSY